MQIEMLIKEIDIEDGSSIRMVCPVCDGGSTREKCLSVTREGYDYLYHCFRDSCAIKGVHSDKWGNHPTKPTKNEPPKNSILSEVKERFGSGYHNNLVAYYNDYLIYKVENGFVVKNNARDWKVKLEGPYINLALAINEKKSLTIKEDPDLPTFGFMWDDVSNLLPWDYFKENGTRVIFVEDIISCHKVARATNIPTIALLGTNVSKGLKNEIKKCRWLDSIIWMLDGDTWDKPIPTSVGQANTMTYDYRNFHIKLGNSDPKDLPNKEIRSLIEAFR